MATVAASRAVLRAATYAARPAASAMGPSERAQLAAVGAHSQSIIVLTAPTTRRNAAATRDARSVEPGASARVTARVPITAGSTRHAAKRPAGSENTRPSTVGRHTSDGGPTFAPTVQSTPPVVVSARSARRVPK